MRAPERTRIYQNHHMDSRRWDYFRWRDGDIVIATSYKAGTTWTQAIVAHLLFPEGDLPAPVGEMSPWIDMRTTPLEVVLGEVEAQTWRRFLKTHLPLDGLPYRRECRYLYVARDARDVFMSLWNHYTHQTDELYQAMNDLRGRVGDEFPRPPGSIHEAFRDWTTRGWFDWETDGYPYWSHLYGVQSWWDHKDQSNIQLIHFGDLLEDTERECRRIADFLEIRVPEARWPEIIRAVSFDEMRRDGDRYVPGAGAAWRGGSDTFFHKGTNGRWRGVLGDDELALYDAACLRTLTPACRRWMERGGAV